MSEIVAGIDIGGSKIAIALETLQGEKVLSRRLPTQVQLGPHLILENISTVIEEMLQEAQATLGAIGIGCPGPMDIERGLVLSPINLPGWDDFPLARMIEERLHVPTVLENDANAAALGEYIYGAGRGLRNIAYVTISTGIGGSIIINGEIVHGVDAGAGEVGHMTVLPDGPLCGCGLRGCLEALCSGTSIARRARERLERGEPSLMAELAGNPSEITAQAVASAALRGDKVACQVWDETCYYLAIGIANVITLLAPEAVILGGGVATVGEQLLGPLRPLIRQRVKMIAAEKVHLRQAALGGESGVRGALVIARRYFLSKLQQTH